jgi:hypothetical protein
MKLFVFDKFPSGCFPGMNIQNHDILGMDVSIDLYYIIGFIVELVHIIVLRVTTKLGWAHGESTAETVLY